MLGMIFGCNRDAGTGEKKSPHNDKLYDLYCSSNIIREIKSRRMRLAGHVA